MTPAIDPGADRVRQNLHLTQADFHRFAKLSGDHNPIHVDPVFSAQTRFGATVSHGMLLFTVLRGLIQRHYPDTRMTHQTLKFPAPAYADEPLVMELSPQPTADPQSLTLQMRILKADGRSCLEGECRLARPTGATADGEPS